MLTTGIALKKELQEFICQCMKAQSEGTGHILTHRSSGPYRWW